MLFNRDYRQAVARALSAENDKASILIGHRPSLGVARESNLRALLNERTPEPYRLTSGFITQSEPTEWRSRQCDILVYDPQIARPYYGQTGLEVVPKRAATMLIEVKTSLDEASFKDILAKWEDVHWLTASMLGFAYDGVSFDTFCRYIESAVREAPRGLPACVAVHAKNYLYMRTPYHGGESSTLPNGRRRTRCQFLVDFEAANAGEGTATALFMDIYLELLHHNAVLNPILLQSCRRLAGSDEHIYIIDESTM